MTKPDDGEPSEGVRQMDGRLTAEIQEQVLARSGGRCEGEVDPSGRMKWTERCSVEGAVGEDLHMYIEFNADISDEPLKASDVVLLCDSCYQESEIAENWAHFDHVMSKDD
jgi:hypothetical protein